MDREALVRRNLQMAAAFHQPPAQHRLRHYLIEAVASFPFAPLNLGWNRILFIKPDHIGDMLLAIPAIRALKNARPYTEVHVLAGPWAASVLANYPEIDLVLTMSFPGFDRNASSKNALSPYFQLLRVSRQLRRIGYGSAVIMRHDHWWGAMLAHVAGIRERIGYDLPDVAPFLTVAHPYHHEHVVRQGMRLVEKWTGSLSDEDIPFDFPVYDDDLQFIDTYLNELDVDKNQRIIAIHPGTGTWAKLWETEKWAKVADTLTEQMNARIVFTGTDHERWLIGQIQSRMQHRSYTTAGDLRLEQLAALYQRAYVVLGPDSGPMHLAASVDTPTVVLYGPADPVEFGPFGDPRKHAVLTSSIGCRPCRVLEWGDDDPVNHPCMREITVGQVLEAARKVTNFSEDAEANLG